MIMRKEFFVGLIAVGLLLPWFGCGGSSSKGSSSDSSGSLSTVVTVAVPTPSNLSAPFLVDDDGLVSFAETAPTGMTVTVEDLAGNDLPDITCTTDAEGKCTLTGFTEAQLTTGCVTVADNPSDNVAPVRSLVMLDAAEITAAKTSTPPSVNCNTETDIGFAATKAACGGTLGSCPETVDPDCVAEAMAAVIEGDESPSATDMDGYTGAILHAHQVALLGSASAATSPADALAGAFEGSAGIYTGQAGSTAGEVPVADAVTNFNTMIDMIRDSYCNRADAASDSPWDTMETDAGADFSGPAAVGFLKEFIPSDFALHEPEDIRGFGLALPKLPGGMAIFGAHDEAREAIREQFLLGSFQNPAHAGTALGLLGAAFPPPPTAGDWQNIPWTGFDPEDAALCADNGYREMGEEFRDDYTPDEIYNQWKDTLSNTENRQAFARGVDAWEEIMGGFTGDPTGWVPGNFEIKNPPGGECESPEDCLPCDTCSNGICVSGSIYMGAACTDDGDCDDGGITTCRGGLNKNEKGACMCASDCPDGAFVFQEGIIGPAVVGAVGGFERPVGGAVGSRCGAGQPPCQAGTRCDFDICVDSAHKLPPNMPCDRDDECDAAGGCDDGLCADFSGTELAEVGAVIEGFGAKAIAEPCTGGGECASGFCNFAAGSVCATEPVNFTNPDAFQCDNDGICDNGESNANCANDCTAGGQAVCGNMICNVGETAQSCSTDCASGGANPCGDGTCNPNTGENSTSCPADCVHATEVVCNDNIDNDNDGKKDCQDSNCSTASNCGGAGNTCITCMQGCTIIPGNTQESCRGGVCQMSCN